MSIQVTFYQNYSKFENSTATPNNLVTSWNTSVLLKEGCTISKPEIEVKLDSATDNPATWNYAYIPGFARYYYVRNWRSYRGLWTAELSCDVLASFKWAIGNSTQYIARCSAEKDGRIIDNFYPKSYAAYRTTTISRIYTDVKTDWRIVCAIVSGGSSGLTGLAYYIFTLDSFNEFTHILMGSGQQQFLDNFGDVTDIMSVNVARILFNPFDYIAGVWLYPVSGVLNPSIVSVSRIELGYWNINLPSGVTAGRIQRASLVEGFTTQFDIPKHPQSTTYGEYLNYTDYTTHILHFPPFDDFQLDYPTFCDTYHVDVLVEMDLTSGNAVMMLLSNSKVIATKYADVGIQLQISGLAYNANSINLSMGSIPKMSASMYHMADIASDYFIEHMTGNPAGDLATFVKSMGVGIKDAAQDIFSTATTAGRKAGSLAQTLDGAYLRTCFNYTVSRNPTELGYPLCQNRQISSIPGFIKCASAEIGAGGAFQNENELITQYMDAGFYYE